MKSTHRLALPILAFFAAFALGCTADADSSEEADATESALTRALPITGEWAVVRWTGQATVTQGSLWEHHRIDERFDAQARQGLATFKLGPDGDGSLLIKARCRPEVPQAGGGPASPTPSRAGVISATYALVSAVLSLIELATCDPSRTIEREARVWPKRDFFGRSQPSLWKNVGVYGEGSSAKAADNECRAMRGTRWIVFDNGAAACVGFADGTAQTLKLMVQRPSEIYVQRILMRRPSER